MTRSELPVGEEERPSHLNKVQPRAHSHCFVCGSENNCGLHLDFSETTEGVIKAYFNCDRRFQGYSGFAHGGIVSSLLDGAMTNCLFAHGLAPLTAELKVRFRHPLLINEPATVRAWLAHPDPPLYALEAEIIQENLIKARAWGKFLDSPHSSKVE